MSAVEIELRNLLTAIQAEGRLKASGRALDVDVTVESDVPRRVRLDGVALERVLSLLVGRAIECSSRGAVEVSVARIGSIGDESIAQLRFGVRDNAPVKAPSTVDPFQALLQSGESDLDLALWDQLVPRVADEWGYQASPGQGTTYWFNVNAIVIPEETAETSGMQATTEVIARVLVVEDNLINQKVAEQLIKRMGYEVDVVGDGAQAVARMAEQRYGLVLMDCQMPVMDGYEATAQIRQSERDGDGRRTPIVALTAHAMSGNRERCLEIGMDDFVTKPVTRDVLERVIGDWMKPPIVPGNA
jgi:CheY-like chemotaxis protein